MPRHTEIAHLSSPYLNSINDAFIGSGSSTGTGAQPYPGQLGAFMELTEVQALAMSAAPATLTLHEGIYQYVQLVSTSTAAAAVGQVAFWSTRSGYVVSADTGPTLLGFVAGIFINVLTKGNYGWIQIAGTANVKFKSSLTAATPAIGDLVIVDQSATTSGAAADDPTQATGLTSTTTKSILGVSEAAPVASATQLVQLWPRFWNE
jgi:hypothetical protein